MPDSLLQELLAYVQNNERVCPMPQRWAELYELLPGTRRVAVGWEPALPLILAAWWESSSGAKRLRLREHLEYAERHGVLADVDRFVRALPEWEWAHSSDFGGRSR